MGRNDWDQMYRNRSLNEIPWHTKQPDRHLIRLINEKKIKQGLVLDLCSGDGTNSIYLASKGFQVMGVDISPTAVNIAKSRSKERKLSCDFHVGDVLKFKYDKTFDFIFDRGCFHHISKKNKPKYVKLVRSLLRSKGKLYLLCFSDKNPPYEKNLSKKDIKDYFSEDFHIHFIKDSVHQEASSKNKRHLHAVFMEKKT